MSVQLCPNCGGQGHVAKPPWVAGDVYQWLSHNTGGYTCRVCNGFGYLAVEAAVLTAPEHRPGAEAT